MSRGCGRVAALIHGPAPHGKARAGRGRRQDHRAGVETERLAPALRVRLDDPEALRRVATLVARQHAPEEVFAVSAKTVRATSARFARWDLSHLHEFELG